MFNLDYNTTTRFTQLLDRLLKTRLRIDNILDNLILLMSISKQTNISKIDRNILYNSIHCQTDIIKLFKLSILIQKSIIQGYVPDCDIMI